MPQTPKPRVLPRVTYAPPQDQPPNTTGALGTGGNAGFVDPYAAYGQMGAGEQWDNVRAQASNILPAQADAHVGYNRGDNPFAQFPNGEEAWAAYQAGKYADNEPPPTTGMDSRQEDTADARAARIQQARASSINRQIDENTKATDAARASGDTEALARLQREWEQLKASPVYQQFFAGNDEQANKEHLINIYMKPDRANAATSLADAAVLAAKDKIWGDEATQAFGRPPTQQEWDEHYYAMNFGGRDPLDGHAQQIQNIQAKARDLNNLNNTSSYDTYSGWLTGK